jgi:hypothetical protein
MKNLIRHGDLALISVTNLPEGLKKAKTDVIMTGSHGNNHKSVNCDLYFKNENQFVFGYLVAKKGAKLLHLDHGVKKNGKYKETKELKEGIYQLRRQFEDTHSGMKQVID